jgi:hypothetical protein
LFHPFLFEKRKREHHHFNQVPIAIAGLDSNTPISMLGSMTLLFDKLFHFFNKKKNWEFLELVFLPSVNLTNFSKNLGNFLQVFYITHFL